MALLQANKLFSCFFLPTEENVAPFKKLSDAPDLKSSFSNNGHVRVISIAEYKAAALALAEAFAEDDVARYFLDTPERAHWTKEQKWDLHVSIFEYLTYAHCMRGLVTTIGEDYGCVALWLPPGKNMDDLYTTIRSGLWRLNYRLCREGRTRFFSEFFPVLHDTKTAIMGNRDNDSWYLVYVGTRPSARGKGYARKTITYVTDMADKEGAACYLESSNDINPAIYAKMGFEIKSRIGFKRGDKKVELDIMVREPVVKEDDPDDLMIACNEKKL